MFSIVALAVALPAITALLVGAATYRFPISRPYCGAVALAAAVLAGTYANPPWDVRRDRIRRHWHWFAELAVATAAVSPLLYRLPDRSRPTDRSVDPTSKATSGRLPWVRLSAQAVAFVGIATLAAWLVVPTYGSLVPRPPIWRVILGADISLLSLCLLLLIRSCAAGTAAAAYLLGSIITVAAIATGSSLTFAQAALPAVAATTVLAIFALYTGDRLVLRSIGCGWAVLHAGWSLVATVEPVQPQTLLLVGPWVTVCVLAAAAAFRRLFRGQQRSGVRSTNTDFPSEKPD